METQDRLPKLIFNLPQDVILYGVSLMLANQIENGQWVPRPNSACLRLTLMGWNDPKQIVDYLKEINYPGDCDLLLKSLLHIYQWSKDLVIEIDATGERSELGVYCYFGESHSSTGVLIRDFINYLTNDQRIVPASKSEVLSLWIRNFYIHSQTSLTADHNGRSAKVSYFKLTYQFGKLACARLGAHCP